MLHTFPLFYLRVLPTVDLFVDASIRSVDMHASLTISTCLESSLPLGKLKQPPKVAMFRETIAWIPEATLRSIVTSLPKLSGLAFSPLFSANKG